MLRSLLVEIQRFVRGDSIVAKSNLLDAGCGDSPYLHLFRGRITNCVRVDPSSLCRPDIMASTDSLPFANATFDMVLCFQVLEHLPNPEKTILELYRVLREGGVLLLSTHGVWNYHGSAAYGDFRRWTRQGLELELSHCFRSVQVLPAGDAVTCLFQVINIYLNGLPVILTPLKRLGFLVNNLLATSPLKKMVSNDTFAISYLCIARKV